MSDADRRNVLDPMTSTLNRVGGNGDPLSPQACGRKVSVFDGRMRFDLRSEFKRIEVVKAEKGYSGPVVVCAVYFVPISGYVPDRPAIKYLVALARCRSVAGADLRHPRAGAVTASRCRRRSAPACCRRRNSSTVAKPPRAAAT